MKISDAQIDNLVNLLDGYAEKGGHHCNRGRAPYAARLSYRTL